MTVGQWIDFMSNEENVVIGLKKDKGLSCPLKYYFPAEEAKEKFKDWIDETVINAYPFNASVGGKNHCLLIFQKILKKILTFSQ